MFTSKAEKFDHLTWHLQPLHLGKSKRSHFQQNYQYVLPIICVMSE